MNKLLLLIFLFAIPVSAEECKYPDIRWCCANMNAQQCLDCVEMARDEWEAYKKCKHSDEEFKLFPVVGKAIKKAGDYSGLTAVAKSDMAELLSYPFRKAVGFLF